MNELSLFTGAGGGVYASSLLGHRIVGYVESDDYCQRVIRQRVRDGIFDDAPIFSDVRTFDGFPYRGGVDLLSAGFPCQPFSVAGRKRGADDERNMWPETVRILREVRPRLAFLENVPGLLGSHGYFGTILGDLAESGYDARWCCLSAAACGAPHIRDRLWILAYARSEQLRNGQRRNKGAPRTQAESRDDGAQSVVADADVERRSRPEVFRRGIARVAGSGEALADAAEQPEREPTNEADTKSDCGRAREEPCGGSWWAVEPAVGRVAHGVADRSRQLRALGNGQVPIVAATAFRILTEAP